ncbi:CDP-6-deoxy-delta-3,4-glucoseen reductase [Pigmentiphaga sp. NML080357]|uniref:CDP-6-deoxy-delta-3,4-glucoseen reductase n=1 Tax=Pigmentiphaga sp. NML080357 TaxID=2008675 RepID=UPI000B40A7A9|nr:CDP-6-deoxy-delta-3,4-glucoseen reductase [Pigmentiphaga sp. NML080357]OVZ57171.1 CDP-6-deoxy-delta-3,4-glucoseen reductase [Pigmentiphaga sp. NML080357]
MPEGFAVPADAASPAKSDARPAGHTVRFHPSGRSIHCPDGITVLAAALAQGITLPFSCRSGVCRTCRGRVLHGEVDPGFVHPSYLSADERRAGHAHLCQAKPLSDCTIEIAEFEGRTFPVRQLPARILALRRAAPDVAIVRIGLPPNEPLHYHAGQYLDVVLEHGLRRSYSIATPPRPDGVRQLELHIRHLPGGRFTDRVFESMQARDLIRVEAPNGQFFLREDSDKPIIMLASGTGFAPIKAMVEHSLARGSRRPILLYWGARRRSDLYLDELPRSWAREHPHIRYIPVLSEPTPACAWNGPTGLVHLEVLSQLGDLRAYQTYACGAPAMVEAARRDFTAAGLPAEDFLADAFVNESHRERRFPTEIPS